MAGITLALLGQTSAALTIKRDQHFAWVGFHYYLNHKDDAILFVASGPLRQRDKAEEIMKFSDEAAADPKRIAELDELVREADRAYKDFPGLRIKPPSAKPRDNTLIDWGEPGVKAMMKAIVEEWPEELKNSANAIAEAETDEWVRKQAKSAHFFHSDFPSQDLHGTPMGLVIELGHDEPEKLTTIKLDEHDPNVIIYMYLWYPLGVMNRLVELTTAKGFKDRLIKLQKATDVFKDFFEKRGAPIKDGHHTL